jgi:uncharacterized surface protein with fasciclin (FAS1) repeats
VVAGVLVLAAVAGLLAGRSFWLGAALLVLLVAVALYAALSRPLANEHLTNPHHESLRTTSDRTSTREVTMNTTLRRTGIAAIALGATLGLAACGSDGSSTAADSAGDTSSDTGMTGDAGAEAFGAACSAVPKSGPGSFTGMATAPVASAAGANPVLSTLVTAVKKAGLVDTLNSQKAITVFAPTNDAFGKIPPKPLEGVLASKDELTKILTYHVVAGKIAPAELDGTHKTLEGDTVTVSGSGDSYSVGTQKASIVCGNVPTANATVYIIDSVLMPQM